MNIKRARVLTPSEIRHLLRVTRATSRHPDRDCLVLLLGLAVGMRITEIASLDVADIFYPSGKLRQEISLTKTKGNMHRLAYLTNPKLVEALDQYIAWRKSKRFCCSFDETKYRGLIPTTRLILTWKGSRYEMCEKMVLNFDGEPVYYHVASSLQDHVTGLYKAAGLKGGTSHSGRRTIATRMIQDGYSVEDVQKVLGHKSLDITACYIDVDPAKLRKMCTEVL